MTVNINNYIEFSVIKVMKVEVGGSGGGGGGGVKVVWFSLYFKSSKVLPHYQQDPSTALL